MSSWQLRVRHFRKRLSVVHSTLHAPREHRESVTATLQALRCVRLSFQTRVKLGAPVQNRKLAGDSPRRGQWPCQEHQRRGRTTAAPCRGERRASAEQPAGQFKFRSERAIMSYIRSAVIACLRALRRPVSRCATFRRSLPVKVRQAVPRNAWRSTDTRLHASEVLAAPGSPRACRSRQRGHAFGIHGSQPRHACGFCPAPQHFCFGCSRAPQARLPARP